MGTESELITLGLTTFAAGPSIYTNSRLQGGITALRLI
jgi:hypothetical protein